MPTLQDSLNNIGGITKAVLNALDQIEQTVAASQIGPDGKPSGTAVYMHMPKGYPVDPKMYSNAWTPGGGDSANSFSNDGTFVQPAAALAPAGATATDGKGPAGAVYPPPKPQPDQQLEHSIQSAFYTSRLVDDMLEVTNKGIAAAWPERRVSIEYYTILEGIQPVADIEPEQSVLDAVKEAQDLLFIRDDKGNFVGYTQLYAQYRKNRTAWTNAIGAQAAAYARAMSDPIAGQAWPVEAATFANNVQMALDDFNSMGRREVENALNTIATVGQSAIKALTAMARQLYDAFSIQLGGSISVGVPWSYINPISWWDYTNNSFGIQKITASSSSYEAAGGAGRSSFSNNWWNEQSSSTSGSAGISIGPFGGGANAGHSDASNAFADHGGQASWSHFSDKSNSAEITLEYFIATIERPWMVGDLFNMEGWYLVGQEKESISNGKIDSQIGDHKKLLPMIPKAFLIVRNVKIKADDWGDAANAFESAQQNASGSGESSSNSFGASVSYFFASASVQHSDQQAGGAFGSDETNNSAWSFKREGNGGTLELMGSQIVGWIGEIQPACPTIDDPSLIKKEEQTETVTA